MQRHGFTAMGTEIELLLDAPATAESAPPVTAVATEFARLEALLSRFRADSELSELNRRGALDAGPELAAIVRLALSARARHCGPGDAKRCGAGAWGRGG